MDIADRTERLDFAIDKSLRYHQRRRAHYERLHRLVMFGVILSGSAALGDVFAEPKCFALLGTILATLDLVFGFSMKARDHVMLYSDFTALLIEIRTAVKPTERLLGEWDRRRLEIEAKEPPIFWAVEASCDNEVTLARGQEASGLVKLGRRHLLLMHWWRFENLNLQRSISEQV